MKVYCEQCGRDITDDIQCNCDKCGKIICRDCRETPDLLQMGSAFIFMDYCSKCVKEIRA